MTTTITADALTELLAQLDQEALATLLARAAQIDRVTDWRARIARPIVGCVGYAARKALVRFSLTDAHGHEHTLDLALKHFAGWKGAGEHRTYAWLHTRQAPVPRCAGALRDRAGDEVLFLELLPHVGFTEAEQAAHLTALARFSALPPPPPDLLPTPPQDLARMASDAVAYFPRLAADARTGLMGEEIRQLITDGEALWPLLAVHFAPAVATLQELPVGLLHGDAGPQNAGWRADHQELLLFDLHKVHRGCILWDAAPALGMMEEDRQQALARHWLATLRAAGGPVLTPQELRQGLDARRHLASACAWWWQHARAVDGAVDWTSDREEGRRTYRGWLAGNLRALREDLAQHAPGRSVPRTAHGGAP